jgi:cyanate permease
MSIGVLFFTHGLSNWLPELLRSGGMPMDQAGFWATVPVVVAIFGSLLIPRLAIPSRRIFVLLSLFLCAMGASLLLRGTIGPTFITGLVLDGLARSSMMTVLILTLVEMEGVGKERAGTAGGLFFAAAEIGGVSGPVMLGILYDATGDFSTGLGLLTLVSIFLLALLVLLKKHAGLP